MCVTGRHVQVVNVGHEHDAGLGQSSVEVRKKAGQNKRTAAKREQAGRSGKKRSEAMRIACETKRSAIHSAGTVHT
jgi:hypothetical protein